MSHKYDSDEEDDYDHGHGHSHSHGHSHNHGPQCQHGHQHNHPKMTVVQMLFNFLVVFLISSTAEIMSILATSPLERARVIRQVAILDPSYLSALDGSWLSMWNGVSASCLRVIPVVIIKFVVGPVLVSAVRRSPSDERTKKATVSLLTGIIVTVLTYPIEIVATLMMVDTDGSYKNFIPGFFLVIEEHGFFGLYSGCLVSAIAIMPFVITFFSTMGTLMTLLNSRLRKLQQAPPFIQWLAFETMTVSSYLVAHIVSYSIDTIRRQFQVFACDSFFGCITEIIFEGGISAFYSGIVISMCELIARQSLKLVFYEIQKGVVMQIFAYVSGIRPRDESLPFTV